MMQTLPPLVLLVGGLATRLHPVTKTIPKSLIEIKGEAFICHQLRWLRAQGIREIIMCVGFLGEQIESLIGDGSDFELHVKYVYDGDTLQGTGGAIKRALAFLDNHFFVLYGDSYLNCDFAAIQKSFNATKSLGLMTVYHNRGQWDTSNIEFHGQAIIAYDKVNRTPRMQYIDYGLGILTQQAFLESKLTSPFDLALLYQELLGKKMLAAFEVSERFYEIGSFAGIKELEYYLSG